EEMGDAGASGLLVPRSGPEEGEERDDRHGVVLDDEDLEPVRQALARDREAQIAGGHRRGVAIARRRRPVSRNPGAMRGIGDDSGRPGQQDKKDRRDDRRVGPAQWGHVDGVSARDGPGMIARGFRPPADVAGESPRESAPPAAFRVAAPPGPRYTPGALPQEAARTHDKPDPETIRPDSCPGRRGPFRRRLPFRKQ